MLCRITKENMPSQDDLCPCNSKKKYKDCCYNIHHTPILFYLQNSNHTLFAPLCVALEVPPLRLMNAMYVFTRQEEAEEFVEKELTEEEKNNLSIQSYTWFELEMLCQKIINHTDIDVLFFRHNKLWFPINNCDNKTLILYKYLSKDQISRILNLETNNSFFALAFTQIWMLFLFLIHSQDHHEIEFNPNFIHIVSVYDMVYQMPVVGCGLFILDIPPYGGPLKLLEQQTLKRGPNLN